MNIWMRCANIALDKKYDEASGEERTLLFSA
jgi:hypothetical protein